MALWPLLLSFVFMEMQCWLATKKLMTGHFSSQHGGPVFDRPATSVTNIDRHSNVIHQAPPYSGQLPLQSRCQPAPTEWFAQNAVHPQG